MRKDNFNINRYVGPPDAPTISRFDGTFQKNQSFQNFSTLLLDLQSKLNEQLIINAGLTGQLIERAEQKACNTSSSNGSTQTGGIISKSLPKQDVKIPPEISKKSKQKEVKPKVKKAVDSSDSDYMPNDSPNNLLGKYKLSESKNIPKNYGKSIFAFIKKERPTVEKVLNHTGQNFADFDRHIQKYKNRISTIADLRSLWIDSCTPFAKALRIISYLYVRRHSFSHIFNSRVENFNKHIKYRYKILQGLEKPEQFTQMKDF